MQKEKIRTKEINKRIVKTNENWHMLMSAIIEQSIKDILMPTEILTQKEISSANKFMNSEFCDGLLDEIGIQMSGSELLEKAKKVNAYG